MQLEPDEKRTSFDLKDKVSVVYEKVAAEFGLGVIFDKDFDEDRDIRLVLNDCDFVEAIRAMNEIALGFVVPVNSRLFLVAEDTQNKRRDLEPVATVIIPIPEAMTDEETQQLGQVVQQILEVKRLQVDRVRRQIVMRDTVHRVRLAQAIYDQLSHGRAEVHFDIDLLATNTNDQLDVGVRLPTSFPITNFSTVLQAVAPMAMGAPLVGFGGGKTVFGVAIGAAGLDRPANTDVRPLDLEAAVSRRPWPSSRDNDRRAFSDHQRNFFHRRVEPANRGQHRSRDLAPALPFVHVRRSRNHVLRYAERSQR